MLLVSRNIINEVEHIKGLNEADFYFGAFYSYLSTKQKVRCLYRQRTQFFILFTF